MKKTLLFTFLINSCVIFSQTNISGYINVNSNWNIGGSPYIINGNTLIENGITLTIDPGVVIKFNNNTTIQVNGELKAIGNSENKIVFTSNSLTPNNGDWNHIIFSDSSLDAVYDSEGNYQSGSIVKYCDFTYGGGLGLGLLNINKSKPHVEHSSFSYSNSDGVHIINANPKIDNCIISNNDGAGILSPNYLYQNNIEIINSTINNNSGGGIQIKSAGNGVLKFINNNISYNSKNAIFIYSSGGSGSGTIQIENNIIENNTHSNGAGIYIDGGFDIDIKCNSISKNSGNQNSALFMKNGYNPYTINVNNNVFSENTTSSGHIIELKYQISYTTTFNLKNNLLTNNNAPNYSIMYIWGSLNYDAYKINNNTFSNNLGNSSLSLYGFNGDISTNNFLDNEVNYKIYNLNQTGELTINAKNNFWGTNNINDINVFDWFDNGSLSIIELSPILNSSIDTNSSCSPITLNINDIESIKKDLTISPNPFKDEFKISSVYIENSDVQIDIYTFDGKLIRKENISNLSSGHVSISSGIMTPGVYLCRITVDNKYYISKKLVAK